jgi:hypothetical protein
MITLKSKFSDAYEVCRRLGACEENLVWGQELMKTNPEMLVDESLDILYNDKKAPEGWAAWIIIKGKGEIDEDVQNGFMRKIKDPMTALQLLLKCDHLTDEQDMVLKAKYEGKLPTAEKELRTGIVVIAKSKLL